MTYVMCFTFFEYKVYVKYLMVFVDIKMLKSLSDRSWWYVRLFLEAKRPPIDYFVRPFVCMYVCPYVRYDS